jgi:uncharacterized protein (TIGR02118 family)
MQNSICNITVRGTFRWCSGSGAELKSAAVEGGVAGATPGSAPAFLAIGHLLFDSVEAYQSSLRRHTTEIVADIPNYTNIPPVIQISQVMR